MKRIRNLLLLSIFSLLALSNIFGQKETPKLPIDSSTSKITYSEVIYVDSSANKQELFSKARAWMTKAYKSSTDVILIEDKEAGKIVSKALMPVFHRVLGTESLNGHINYTISIYVKDGRYKYEITDFFHTGQVISDGSRTADLGVCEKMINTTEKAMGISLQKMYNYYLYQLDNNIKALVADLKTAMATKASSIKNDNW